MMNQIIAAALIGVTTLTNGQAAPKEDKSWRIDSAEEWKGNAQQIEGLAVNDNLLSPTDKQGTYRSTLQRFEENARPKR